MHSTFKTADLQAPFQPNWPAGVSANPVMQLMWLCTVKTAVVFRLFLALRSTGLLVDIAGCMRVQACASHLFRQVVRQISSAQTQAQTDSQMQHMDLT